MTFFFELSFCSGSRSVGQERWDGPSALGMINIVEALEKTGHEKGRHAGCFGYLFETEQTAQTGGIKIIRISSRAHPSQKLRNALPVLNHLFGQLDGQPRQAVHVGRRRNPPGR